MEPGGHELKVQPASRMAALLFYALLVHHDGLNQHMVSMLHIAQLKCFFPLSFVPKVLCELARFSKL